MDTIRETLALLKPGDLHPLWRCVEAAERVGHISSVEAARWKQGIFGLMELGGWSRTTFFPEKMTHLPS